jgi:hypothetical protein
MISWSARGASVDRWKPPIEITKKEQFIMKRLGRVRALFGFLREKRHIIFDDSFQAQFEEMYRQSGAGDEPHPPAFLCMVTLLQGYVGASDAEAVELSVMDRRWQMVLDCMNAEEPPFSQGALQAFRERMIAHELDRVLLERTVSLVRDAVATKSEGQQLTKAVRVAIDSRPLAGAGRVEDTINLLGHAARNIVQVVSKITERAPEEICRKAGIPLLLSPSVKAGLDIDWSDPRQKAEAIERVERQVESLARWVERHLDDVVETPLRSLLEAVTTIRAQNLETVAGHVRIRKGVAEDRLISLHDTEMRHGRKSSTKRFDGYKEHIARDLDVPVILACAVTPANRPEGEGAEPLGADIERQGLSLAELHIDRAYVTSPLVDAVENEGGAVLSKPWGHRAQRPNKFSKADFKIDVHVQTITCPAGEEEPYEPGETVQFDAHTCARCPLRAHCMDGRSGRGRLVRMSYDEPLQKKFRRLQSTSPGRAALRARVAVEHALAHIAARKGDSARYVGTRKNLFDLRRSAAIQNLEAQQRTEREAA